MLKTVVEWAVNTGIALGIFWTVYYCLWAIRMAWQALQATKIEYRDRDDGEEEEGEDEECSCPKDEELHADVLDLSQRTTQLEWRMNTLVCHLKNATSEDLARRGIEAKPEDEEDSDDDDVA